MFLIRLLDGLVPGEYFVNFDSIGRLFTTKDIDTPVKFPTREMAMEYAASTRLQEYICDFPTLEKAEAEWNAEQKRSLDEANSKIRARRGEN